MVEGLGTTRALSPCRRVGINAHLLGEQPSYRRAGVSRYIEQLLTHVLQEDPAGDYTAFVSRGGALPLPCRQRLSRFSTRSPWLRILWEQAWLPWEVRTERIELLHSPVNVQPLFLPCRGVVTVTDLSFVLFPHSFGLGQRYYQRWFTRWSARRADGLIAISASTARDLERFFGVAAERIAVTYPGVDPTYRPIDDEALLASFRQRKQLPDKFILFVGTLEPRKNLPILVQAFAQFKRQQKTAHKLVLAGGKGWLYQPIFAAVEELGLRADVIFPGFVPEDELRLWYNLADAFAYPSLYEGFGLPPLEAMACGTPVIVSNASSLPEVVGDAALQVAPEDAPAWADALARVCGDAHLRASLSERGLRRAREFSWARMARQTVQVYQRVGTGGS